MLIFDFDGVLIDSVDETAITSFNVETKSLLTLREELPQGYLNLFRKNRFHLQGAWQFPLLARWCLSECERNSSLLLSEEVFKKLILDSKHLQNTLLEAFFSKRSEHIGKHKSTWLALHKTMQPLWDKLKEKDPSAIIILTNKNKKAVMELASFFKLPLLPNNIYSGDNGKTKTENLKSIYSRFKPEKIYFLDDSVKNLRDLQVEFGSNSFLTPCFATWGYSGPEDKKKAEGLCFLLLSQDELIKNSCFNSTWE